MREQPKNFPLAATLALLTLSATMARGEEVEILPEITVTASPTTDAGYVATQSATGTKTDTPLIETPQTINVITRDELTARAVQSTSQALAYTPGVNSQAFGTRSNGVDFLVLRGFDAPQYLDATRLEFVRFGNQVKIEPYGMERIEVLKGPASVLYGQNAPGGLVNFVSKRPTAEPFREIQLLGGSFDRVQGALDFSGPIDPEGRFLYRLTALVRDSDFQVDFGKDDRYFVAPSFTWRPSEDTAFTVLSHYQKDEMGSASFGQFLPAEGTLLPNPNGKIPTNRDFGEPDDRSSREQFTLGYAFEHRFNETWRVRQNLRYADVTTDMDVVFLFDFLRDDNGVPTDFRTITREAVAAPAQSGTITLDNQAQAVFNTGAVHHTVLLGADYLHRDSRETRASSEAPELDVFNPVYGRPVARPDPNSFNVLARDFRAIEREQFGLYGQDQIRYGFWILTLGGRYDWATADSLGDERPTGTQTRTRQDDEAFTYRTGLGYVFDSGFAPYFSYSESFEPAAGTDFSGKPFVPTTGQQYEVGIKYQPPGYKAFITLSAFHLTQQNVVTPDPDPVRAALGFSVQIGEALVRGIEIEGKASLTEGLDLTTAYAYLDAEITRSNSPGEQGNRLALTPEHQASAWLNYTFQGGALAGFGLGGGVRYVGALFGDTTNSLEVPSYPLFEAAVHYDLGKVHQSLEGARLAVNLSNMLDREYLAQCDAANCEYGDRRTIYASLRYNW